MDKPTRNILIAVGIVVLGGGAYLFFSNPKRKKGKGINLFKDKNKKTFNMGYLQNGYIHIAGDDREEATDYLKKGTKIIIEGGNDDMNGERTISKLWMDANGNLGAFKTEDFTIGYNTSQNRDYENKATISVELEDE